MKILQVGARALLWRVSDWRLDNLWLNGSIWINFEGFGGPELCMSMRFSWNPPHHRTSVQTTLRYFCGIIAGRFGAVRRFVFFFLLEFWVRGLLFYTAMGLSVPTVFNFIDVGWDFGLTEVSMNLGFGDSYFIWFMFWGFRWHFF